MFKRLNFKDPLFHAATKSFMWKMIKNPKNNIKKVIEQLEELKELKKSAYKDPLTGLWNEKYFHERFTEELHRVQRNGPSEEYLSLLLIDIHDLNNLNKKFGKSTANLIIQFIGSLLNVLTRTHDVCCYLEGGHFMILLPGIAEEGVQHLIHRIENEALKGDRNLSGVATLNFGAATWPTGAIEQEALLNLAELELKRYKDKTSFQRSSGLKN